MLTTATITINPALLTTTTTLSVLCASSCRDSLTIDPVTPDTPQFDRVLVIGNAITYQEPIALAGWEGSWGMAVTAPNKDYLSILRTRFIQQNPNVLVKELRDFAGLSATEGAYWEGNYHTYDLTRLAGVKAWNPDLIIVRIGENVIESQMGTRNFSQKYTDLIKYLKGTDTQVVITTSVWDQPVLAGVVRQVAQQNSWRLADLYSMHSTPTYFAGSAFSNLTVAQHPNDAGHLEIANRIWNVLVPPVNPPAPPSGMVGGFAQGTYEELVQFAPFVPDQNQESTWNANTVQYINNGTIKVGLLKSIGGVVYWLGDLSSGENLVNTYKITGSDGTETQGGNHPGGPDTGRSLYSHSYYGTPGQQYITAGQNTNQDGDDTGFNPNPGGSRFLDRSRITFFQKKTVSGYGEVLYVRTPGKQWSMHDVESPVTFNTWWWLDGRVLHCFSLVQQNRPANDGQLWRGREHESPGMYPIAPLNAHYLYNGTAPFTGGNPTRFDTFEQTGGAQTRKQTGSFSTEHWVGAERTTGGTGVYIFTPYNARFSDNQFHSLYGDMNSNASSYINAAFFLDGDSPATTAMHSYIYVGTRTQFRTWLNSANIPLRPLAFNFSGGRMQGCYGNDCRTKVENGKVTWYNGEGTTDNNVTQSKGKFFLPCAAYKASTIPKIYINAAVHGSSELEISWLQSTQENETYTLTFPGGSVQVGVQNRQRKTIAVIGDGQPRTYEITLSDHPYWQNYITHIEFSNVLRDFKYPNLQGSEKVEWNWINTSPVAP